MYKLNHLPSNVLKMLYYAIIVPFLNYGILAWGSAANIYLERLHKLQKRAIRIIYHSSFYAHTEPLFYSNNILKVQDMYRFETGIYMYLCFKGLLPNALLNSFTLNCKTHTYFTRNCANYHLPPIRTSLSYKSIFFQGPITWNSLPDEIKETCTLQSFKRKLKYYYLSFYEPV